MHIIIPQNLIECAIFSLAPQHIKHLIGRTRLKFSYAEIVFYVSCIYLHQLQHKRFKRLFEQSGLTCSYQAFMKNLATLSPLVVVIHQYVLKHYNIHKSSLFNAVDSTLLPTKEEASIRDKDYRKGMVTKRNSQSICGYKGLVFLNKKKQVYFCNVFNINYSDHNFLKDIALYEQLLAGLVLTDKGFSNNIVRERFKTVDHAKLISPYKKNQKTQLTPKEWKIYRHRWTIETLFKELKDNWGNFNLNLRGARNYKLIRAKFFVSVSTYNLATIY